MDGKSNSRRNTRDLFITGRARTRETNMETRARASKPFHPLTWVAGTALTIFGAAGLAAFMGWIPAAMDDPRDKKGLQTHSENTGAAALAKTHTAPLRAENSAPARTRCAECGVVESVRRIDTKGKGSGLGAVGGAVTGEALGNQVGSGKDVMSVAGDDGGAMAGNEAEKRAKSTMSYSVTVRLEDGSSRVFSEAVTPTWRAGDKVKVIKGVIQSDV
jgi:outer membrane lipoprotein SlyB